MKRIKNENDVDLITARKIYSKIRHIKNYQQFIDLLPELKNEFGDMPVLNSHYTVVIYVGDQTTLQLLTHYDLMKKFEPATITIMGFNIKHNGKWENLTADT